MSTVDLGWGRKLEFFPFKPSEAIRRLRPQYDDVPDIDRYGAHITHETEDGEGCKTTIFFDTPEGRKVPDTYLRQFVPLQEAAPLSAGPIACRCGAAGSIVDGKWVTA